jgi:Reverse transcriptase (RNA-dependent DNA polymerase)
VDTWRGVILLALGKIGKELATTILGNLHLQLRYQRRYELLNPFNYDIIWWALKRKLDPTKYVTLIKDMYTNVVTCVRACDGESDTFTIKIGLHQGSALSLYIFTLVMDEITKDIQGDIHWCMLFVDDVVLIDESRIKVNQKLELWR